MNKTNIFTLFGIYSAGVLTSCNNKASMQTRPNIIFIMSDDHAYQAISAYGHGLNETPNIDRLAKEGAIFTRACVTNSICAPSRAINPNGDTTNFVPDLKRMDAEQRANWMNAYKSENQEFLNPFCS